MNLLVALTARVAASLGPEFDIEILEMHHRHKRDAPSGTALMLGDAAAAARGVSLEATASVPAMAISDPAATAISASPRCAAAT